MTPTRRSFTVASLAARATFATLGFLAIVATLALLATLATLATVAVSLGFTPPALLSGEPFFPGVPAASAAAAPIPPACPGNLLIDPGFEEGFTRRGRSDVVPPNGWDVWFERLPGIDGLNYPPAYRPIRDPAFVGAGLWSLEQATTNSTHTGGVLQIVAVGSDVRLRAYGWSSAWASLGSQPETSDPPGTYATAIGIDPLGGTDAAAARIAWSQPITITDTWIEHRIDIDADGPHATLFTRGQPLRILPQNVSRWDGLCLRVLGPAGSTPDPSLDSVAELTSSTQPSPAEGTDAAAGIYATATARAAGVEEIEPPDVGSGTFIGAAATLAAAATHIASGSQPAVSDIEYEDPPEIGLKDSIAEHLGFVALAGVLFCAGLIFGLAGAGGAGKVGDAGVEGDARDVGDRGAADSFPEESESEAEAQP